MTTFAESEIRLRRMLRDPDGTIWSSMDLQTYFNDAQVELAQKTNLLIRVEAQYYPPRYDYAYTYDWEEGYLKGDYYQAFQVNQASSEVITYPWEAGWYLDTSQTPDDGDRFTQSWEVHYCNPAEAPSVLLHAKFDKAKYVAYDQIKLEPTDERTLQDTDRYYKTRTGFVTNYWRPDDYSNLFYLYPRPTYIPDYSGLIGDYFQDKYFVNAYFSSGIVEPHIIYSFDDAGGIISSAEAWLDETDYGLIMDVVQTKDALFMVYSAQPDDIEETTDSSSFPDYMVKYIEQGTLERAYGADTDGFIPSLRDYWKMRKEISLKALMRFQRMTLGDRDYRLGGSPQPTSSKRLRLPDGYPAV